MLQTLFLCNYFCLLYNYNCFHFRACGRVQWTGEARTGVCIWKTADAVQQMQFIPIWQKEELPVTIHGFDTQCVQNFVVQFQVKDIVPLMAVTQASSYVKGYNGSQSYELMLFLLVMAYMMHQYQITVSKLLPTLNHQ